MSLGEIANSSLGSTKIGTGLGVVLAIVNQCLRDRTSDQRKRKQTAAVLGYEIASTRLLASQSREVNPIGINLVKSEVSAFKQGIAKASKGIDSDVLKTIPI